MEAQFEMLSEMTKNGDKLNFGQDFFVKFYQAFLYSDRWQQYFKGVGTTLLVTAIALVLGVVLGAIVAMVRVGHAQQKPHHRNPILGVLNAINGALEELQADGTLQSIVDKYIKAE